jgi:hypothetical protein
MKPQERQNYGLGLAVTVTNCSSVTGLSFSLIYAFIYVSFIVTVDQLPLQSKENSNTVLHFVTPVISK